MRGRWSQEIDVADEQAMRERLGDERFDALTGDARQLFVASGVRGTDLDPLQREHGFDPTMEAAHAIAKHVVNQTRELGPMPRDLLLDALVAELEIKRNWAPGSEAMERLHRGDRAAELELRRLADRARPVFKREE